MQTKSGMEAIAPENVTRLLKAWASGDSHAQERLIPLVYHELHRLARRYGRPEDTLQTTGLVHEAYMRLVAIHGVEWQDRSHFFAVTSQIMRRIMVDRARTRLAGKRGGDSAAAGEVNPDDYPSPESLRASEIIALDDALVDLTQRDPRRARVVELHVFGGLTFEEIADAEGLSPQTIQRDWKLAKAWLLRELSHEGQA